MIPSDYRLDVVTARLVERLEGARRTFGNRAEDAREAFEETADKHVDAAIQEYRAVALEEPASHAAFLRREIKTTALPRYHRLAMAMNSAEAGGFGFGWFAEPVGRIVLTAMALLGVTVLVRATGTPLGWPLLLLDLSIPFWPSIAAALVRRRYERDVQEVVYDMGRIQDAERAYLQGAELEPELEVAPPAEQQSGRAPQRPPQREGGP